VTSNNSSQNNSSNKNKSESNTSPKKDSIIISNQLKTVENLEKDKINSNLNLNFSTISTHSGNNNLNATSINIAPISNPLLNESQLQFDNINKNNMTFHAFPVNHNLHNKNRLRNERNNILGGILGCEVRVKSDQITFTNLDKTAIRKKSSNGMDSIILDSSILDVGDQQSKINSGKK
jgi:hypothetical protein